MKRLLPILALAVMMSACVEPNEPSATRFSVLGDSFSALDGTVDPETNDVWSYSNVGVTSPEQMWWHKVATEMGWVMDKNNSFSGSLVSNFDDFDGGDYYVRHSYLRRMDYLGNPDVILVFGGTNDIYKRAPLGDYVYSDWTEEQLCAYRPAMAYLLDNLKRQHPNAKIYFLIDMELCINDVEIEDATRQAYIESMHHIANHYNVDCIDIYGIHKQYWHPNAQGQDDIARQVLEALALDFNV
jgi:lysophospholipase L1-like esterase